MGKRPNKTAQQKSARVAKKLAKSFAKRLGVSQGPPLASSSSLENGTAASRRSTSGRKPAPPVSPAAAAREGTLDSRLEHQAHLKGNNLTTNSTAPVVVNRNKNNKRNRGRKNLERMDFEREQASARERHEQIEWKRKQQKLVSSSSSQATMIQLHPATFSTEKSTHQLVQEATQQVQGLMQSFGSGMVNTESLIAGFSKTNTTALSSTFSSPVSSSIDPGMATTTDTGAGAATMGDGITHSNNPWHVLQDEDEDQSSRTILWFQLAPASFSIPTSSTVLPPALTDDSIDPDL